MNDTPPLAAGPLAGRTIAIPETRQLDLLATMLEERGATVLRCPLVSILDAPDAAPVEAWLRDFSAGGCDDLILLTGEGLRRLLGFAERMGDRTGGGTREAFVAALGRVRRVTRGPKPARVLTDLGLRTDLTAPDPTTGGVIAALSRPDLSPPIRGRRVGVQLYGTDPNERLIGFLRSAGAAPVPVSPYVYAPAGDEERVVELVSSLSAGEVDVIAFTSASQVSRLWDVAAKHGQTAALEAGIARTTLAAVGPVVAEELEKRGGRVTITPAKNFFMKPLVNEIVAAIGK